MPFEGIDDELDGQFLPTLYYKEHSQWVNRSSVPHGVAWNSQNPPLLASFDNRLGKIWPLQSKRHAIGDQTFRGHTSTL